MSEPTDRDLELLSAYLDSNLSGADAARLESRIKADPELRTIYDSLRQTRSLLRQLPARRAPRNFRLTPQMVGMKPSRPRSFPFFRLASALATILLFLGYAVNLSASGIRLGAAAPAMAPAATEFYPYDTYSVPAAEEPTETAPTEAMLAAPTEDTAQKVIPTQEAESTSQGMDSLTPTPETMSMDAANSTEMMPLDAEDTMRSTLPQPPALPIDPLWLFGLLGLATVSGASAFIVEKRSNKASLTTREIVLLALAIVLVLVLAAGIYWMSVPQ